MSDIGICEYCKYVNKDITENPCLHCAANLGAFEFDLSYHDAKIRADAIDDERSSLLAYICKKIQYSVVGYECYC